jgi:four helix bundle protein
MDYNLEERTTRFGKEIIKLAKRISKNVITLPIISQLVKAGTSVDANYREANGASSRKDFKNKIYICKKEVQETKYWLEMSAEADPAIKEEARILWKEAQELTLIFTKIVSTMNKRMED